MAPESCIQNALIQKPGIRYLGIDRYDDDANATEQDLTNLTYEAGSFDLLICSHVLEHIPDDRAALSEIYRVLRPGGLALIMVPIDRNRDETYEDPQIVSPSARHEAPDTPITFEHADGTMRIVRASGFDVREAHSTEMPEHKRRSTASTKPSCTIAPPEHCENLPRNLQTDERPRKREEEMRGACARRITGNYT